MLSWLRMPVMQIQVFATTAKIYRSDLSNLEFTSAMLWLIFSEDACQTLVNYVDNGFKIKLEKKHH